MNKFLNRFTSTIFVMLGSSCNLHCRYCLQQCQEIPKLPDKINPDIYEFFKERIEENSGYPLHLQFYGGEPLIYFDKIKEIVEKTKDMNITYSTISNGRALTQKMVDFLNEYNFHVTISWDGPNVLKTRKFDAMQEKHDLILSLHKLGLSAVLSAESYPREVSEAFSKILDEHDELHKNENGCYCSLNFDYIFDTGITDKSLVDEIDYERMTSESYEMTKEYIELVRENSREAYTHKYEWTDQLYNAIRYCYESKDPNAGYITKAYCDNGYGVLNMDLAGNLYPCHNIFDKIGDIYMPYYDYLTNVIRTDNNINLGTKCSKCPAFAICNGGCKLIKWGTPEKESFCKLKKAVMGGVLQAYIEYGKEIRSHANPE